MSDLLPGRLGLAEARVPQADREGVLWLAWGRLYVAEGCLRFVTAATSDGGGMPPGDYGIPFQNLTAIVLQPGTSVSHDAMRLLASHGTALVASAVDGVRLYASFPHGPDRSARARRHARLWADEASRVAVARRMYAIRLGEVLPSKDIASLRGMEGIRAREMYQKVAAQFGISWRKRQYDRDDPMGADGPNQALNHASTAVYAAAGVAVAVCGAIPQLGFIHEDSGRAFVLDIADMFRDAVTLPAAFGALKAHAKRPREPLERAVRQAVGKRLRKDKTVVKMIGLCKELLDGDNRDP